jgi:acyl carrier protein
VMLVTFLEEWYQIEFHAHETGVDHMNTIESIARLVYGKLALPAG